MANTSDNQLKQLSIIIAITAALILLPEFFLVLIGYKPEQDTFQMKVCGELIGQFDEKLFWRRKGIKPKFNCKSKQQCLKIMCLTDSVSVMHKGKGYPEILQKMLSSRIPMKNHIVFNGGVPGYTSYQGLRYFKTELLAYHPDIIIVCYGWNDHWQSGNGLPDKLQRTREKTSNIFPRTIALINHLLLRIKQNNYSCVGPKESMRVSITDYEKNIREIIRIGQMARITIVLLTAPSLDGPQEWTATHQDYNRVVRKISKDKKLPIVDLVEEFHNREDLFIDPINDKCHYNWKGSEIIARKLFETILNIIEPKPSKQTLAGTPILPPAFVLDEHP